MTLKELRNKYLEFWSLRNSAIIPSSSLVPENDPTTLFTNSGMQPLLSYFLGQPHPLGTRVVDSQKCFRAEDIEEVGDNRHTTFFEMLGNWSFGDYFKRDQLSWYFEFLVKILGLKPERIYVTVFSGDDRYTIIDRGVMGPDVEAISIWKELFARYGIDAKERSLESLERASQTGMGDARIFSYDVKKNWWSRSGPPEKMPVGEPGGPDSEVFYEFPQIDHDPKFGQYCHPNCDCGRYLEIGNSVFMQFQKVEDYKFKELPKKNVDFGGGIERTLSAVIDSPDIFEIDALHLIISQLEGNLIPNFKYDSGDQRIKRAFRIIADHMRAVVFLMADGILPANKNQGYVLRRLLRRAIVQKYRWGNHLNKLSDIVDPIVEYYLDDYPELQKVSDLKHVIDDEDMKFLRIIKTGYDAWHKLLLSRPQGEATFGSQKWGEGPDYQTLSPKEVFHFITSYGLPLEIIRDDLKWKGDYSEVERLLEEHKQLSRTTSAGMFKGGLADQSETITKYHTTTHLLQAALRQVLGTHVRQEGSNITGERLRFDFSHSGKLTSEEISKVEEFVNSQIDKNLERKVETMSYKEAINSGALAFYKERYPEKVTVYSFGEVSREVCGGPHVENTKELGNFKIIKEEGVAAGIRRIYAKLEG